MHVCMYVCMYIYIYIYTYIYICIHTHISTVRYCTAEANNAPLGIANFLDPASGETERLSASAAEGLHRPP